MIGGFVIYEHPLSKKKLLKQVQSSRVLEGGGAERSSFTDSRASAKKQVIEFRWLGILIAKFRAYLTLQMQSFSAWRTEVMIFVARENVFQLGELFETREANKFHHLISPPLLVQFSITFVFGETASLCSSSVICNLILSDKHSCE